MDTPSGHSQSVDNWPVHRDTAHIEIQVFPGYPMPGSISLADPSSGQSSTYTPSHPQILHAFSHIGHSPSQPMPEEQSYSHPAHGSYTKLPDCPQAPSPNVLPATMGYLPPPQPRQRQIQHRTLGIYLPTAAMPDQNRYEQGPQAPHDETALYFTDYLQHPPSSSLLRSNVVAPSPESTQGLTQKRRAPYTSPHRVSVVPRILDRKRNGLSVRENQCPVPAINARSRRKFALHDDVMGLAEGPTTTLTASTVQALSMRDTSPIKPLPTHLVAGSLPIGSETPQTLVWTANHEAQQQQLKPEPEPRPLDQNSSSIPQTLSPIASGTTPTIVTGIQAHSTGTDTMFIHSHDPRASTNPGDGDEDYDEYKNFFPNDTDEHRKLRIAMHDVMSADWKTRNELEPTSWILLQFGSKTFEADGSVIFRCLLYHNGKPCDTTWSRAERALAHLRKAINLRPFACEGDGETACNCGQRFFAEDTLQQHRKNINAVKCEYCDSSFTPRNKQRHLRNNCSASPLRV